MTLRSVIVSGVVSMTIAVVPAVLAGPNGKAGERSESAAVEPQLAVVCTGWHALCSLTTDCQTDGGDKADCACWRVDETHIIVTDEIQDPAVKRMTQTKCTSRNTCDVDEAPVCSAIKDGQYEVDQIRYEWVSTFSYRGWCDLYRPKACDPAQPDYVGDTRWAVCDAAPCTEIPDPADPERPLSCQCRVMEGPFIGVQDSCTGENGGLISSVDLQYWDFEKERFSVPVPGDEYVHGACATLKSDPWPPSQE